MADTTTISNLPQITLDELTNDTLIPVENVDGTKAANLMQLRKKLNSVYVELVDADLNALKEDGMYECWGTTLNAPTTEAVTWIVQTATHESLTVQDAFGLGENSYHYFYRRRWNGVAWTAWENRVLSLEKRVEALESASSSLDAAEVGDIKVIAYNTPQAGWLVCNGAAYSRTTYSRLYARIGTTWGAGDGSTTFNVPNRTVTFGVPGMGRLTLDNGWNIDAYNAIAVNNNTSVDVALARKMRDNNYHITQTAYGVTNVAAHLPTFSTSVRSAYSMRLTIASYESRAGAYTSEFQVEGFLDKTEMTSRGLGIMKVCIKY